MWLPLTALLSKAVVLGFHVLSLEGYPFWITVCGDAFFTAALNLFVIWLFVSAALHTRRPELWAGMGRAAELPVAGLAGILGGTLLQAFPSSVTLLVFVAALLLAMVLFYRIFLLYSDTLLKDRAPILLPHTNEIILAGAGEPFTVEEAENTAATFDAAETMDYEAAEILPDEELQAFSTDITDSESAETVSDSEAVSDAETANTESAGANFQNDELTAREEEKLREFKMRYQLSVRETEVLQQILLNRSISEMADALFISPRTVKFHISSLLRKTGASSQRTLKRELTGQE